MKSQLLDPMDHILIIAYIHVFEIPCENIKLQRVAALWLVQFLWKTAIALTHASL